MRTRESQPNQPKQPTVNDYIGNVPVWTYYKKVLDVPVEEFFLEFGRMEVTQTIDFLNSREDEWRISRFLHKRTGSLRINAYNGKSVRGNGKCTLGASKSNYCGT